ncbi:MAG TPA: GntR family transcriptional regulator [Erysipelothrix sp.]|nr:GntR family transcriptional regulator [Erysipelothrix sp.]
MARLSSSSAIYLQIQKFFEVEIASGRLKPGQKLETIRNLAMEFKVNPNTIQKSLQELERQDLIYTDRTNGKFVTEDLEEIEKLNKKLIQELITSFTLSAQKLGMELETVELLLRNTWKGRDV